MNAAIKIIGIATLTTTGLVIGSAGLWTGNVVLVALGFALVSSLGRLCAGR